jgi:Holliday junction resolvase-like predicted endonuclease
VKRETKLVVLNLAFAVVTYFYLNHFGLELWKILPVVLLLLFNLKVHLSRLMRFLWGGYGEQEVLHELKKRLKGYKLFRNLYTGRGDIDVLAVGKSGVHVIEVKKLKGFVIAKKDSVRYGRTELLKQLERNEMYVERLLAREGFRAPVKGHLIVLGKIKGKNKKLAKNVRELVKHIKGRAVLDFFTVDGIAALFYR